MTARTPYIITQYRDDTSPVPRNAIGVAWGRSTGDAVKAWCLYHGVSDVSLDAMPWTGKVNSDGEPVA